jgi:hypothetical protein
LTRFGENEVRDISYPHGAPANLSLELISSRRGLTPATRDFEMKMHHQYSACIFSRVNSGTYEVGAADFLFLQELRAKSLKIFE